MLRRNKNARKVRDDDGFHNNSLVYDPPPIWFSPKKKPDGEGKSIMESTYKEIESYFDLTNKPLGKFKAKIRVLRDPSPEDWLVWLKEVDEFFESKLDLSP